MDKVTTVPGREMFGPDGDISKEQALNFAKTLPAFKNWITSLETTYGTDLKGVTIIDVTPFAIVKDPNTKAITQIKPMGFVFAKALAHKGTNPKTGGPNIPPGIAFIRGNAVCVLVILKDKATGKEYVATVIQPRIPGGSKAYEEIPAGMMDAANDVAGVAAKELEEELGLKIKGKDLVKLSEMYPSIGGSDEKITVYAYRVEMPDITAIKNYNQKQTGALGENEMIETRIRSYENFKDACRNGEITDAKAQLALGLYEMLKAEKGEDAVPLAGTMQGGRHRGKKHSRKTHKAKRHHKKRGTRRH